MKQVNDLYEDTTNVNKPIILTDVEGTESTLMVLVMLAFHLMTQYVYKYKGSTSSFIEMQQLHSITALKEGINGTSYSVTYRSWFMPSITANNSALLYTQTEMMDTGVTDAVKDNNGVLKTGITS